MTVAARRRRTSSWSTSRSAWPPTPAPAGPARRSSAASPARASASRPAARPSGRASCTGSTSAPAASWSWRSPSGPTPCSSGRSRSARSTRSTTRSSRVIPTRCAAPSTPRSAATRRRLQVGGRPPSGKPSVTHYDTLEAFRAASLLEVHLETGRTHQIRVHMAALRHPCVGDLTYGADPTLSRAARTDPAVAARRTPRVRPSRHRRADRVHQRLSRRPRGRAGAPARGVMTAIRLAGTPEEVAAAFAVRHDVFVTEQGVPADLERDDQRRGRRPPGRVRRGPGRRRRPAGRRAGRLRGG